MKGYFGRVRYLRTYLPKVLLLGKNHRYVHVARNTVISYGKNNKSQTCYSETIVRSAVRKKKLIAITKQKVYDKYQVKPCFVST